MMGYGYGGYGVHWLGMLIPLLLIGLIIYAVVKLTQNNSKKSEHKDALDVLNERFANGEISEEEYMHKKKLLKD